MTRWVLLLALLGQVILAAGQVLMKLAMSHTTARGPFVARFAGSIALQTVYFFLWLGILNWVPLSQLAPFDAVGPILIVIAAHVTLRERLAGRALAGVLLVIAGVCVIACS